MGIGSLMILLSGLGLYYNWRGTIKEKPWILWSFVFAIVFVITSNHSGWIAAEVGRQPWTVNPPVTWNDSGDDLVVGADGFVQYDESEGLRTNNSISASVTPAEALTSLILFSILYLALLAVWVFVLDRKIRKGPEPIIHEATVPEHGMRQATIDRQHARFEDEEDGKGGAA